MTVDLRDDIRFESKPFSKIMRAASGLGPGERLLLLAPFEPAPLFAVLQKQGFGHSSRPLPSGDWEVLFTRQSPPQLSTNNMTVLNNASVSMLCDLVTV